MSSSNYRQPVSFANEGGRIGIQAGQYNVYGDSVVQYVQSQLWTQSAIQLLTGIDMLKIPLASCRTLSTRPSTRTQSGTTRPALPTLASTS
jgi:hypothetical protein